MESWRQGIKAVAIYRDNSKGTQPLNVSAQTDDNKKGTKATNKPTSASASETLTKGVILSEGAAEVEGPAVIAAHQKIAALEAQVNALQTNIKAIADASLLNADAADSKAPPRAVRHRLPAERASVTHKFGLGGHEGYITVGLYPNGSPGEIFIRMAKEGSTVSGLMDSFATAVSLALQHGVPLTCALREVRPHPLRALRLDRQPRDRLRQVHHGLHLPLDPDALPLRHPARPLRRPASHKLRSQ